MILLQVILPLLVQQTLIVPFTIFLPQAPLFATMLGSLLAVPALLYFYLKKHPDAYLKSTHPGGFWKAGIYLFISGMGISILVNNIISLSGIGRIFTGYQEVARELYQPSLLLQAAGAGFIIPMAEELVFRAFAFRCLRSWMGFYRAAFWSALYFGIYHGNLLQGLYAFIIGIILAYVYERSQTIIAPFILHVSANLTSIAVTYFSAGLSENQNLVIDPLLMGISVLLTFTGFRFFQQYQAPKGEEL